MMFMGRTAEEWRNIELVYSKIAPVLETPEGKRLLMLGELN